MEPLRIGILGAARITEMALITPAHLTGQRLVAVSARDHSRAVDFQKAHGIEKVVGSYQDLIDDPEVDVIYNPLPNGLHGPWNIRALQANKHVLSEKPSTSNEQEAKAVLAATASSSGKFMEAFHYRYHPVINRMIELVENGELGEIRHIDVVMGFPLDNPADPRWDFDLAGGALMDVGCYAVHALRSLGAVLGGEPTIADATAIPAAHDERVDLELLADVVFPSGTTGHLRSSFAVPEMTFTLKIVGSLGEAFAHNFCVSALDDRITISTPSGSRVENLGVKTSYTWQLEAFWSHIRDNTDIHTGPEDALVQSAFLDALYLKAGLPLRPTTVL
jgi:predicted dehydrogenase